MNFRFLLLLSLVIGLSLPLVAADAVAKPDDGVKKKKKGNVVHMVAFKFKDTASKDDIKKVETEFKALKKKIPQIVSYDWGLNHSPEGLNKGLTHGFLLTFATPEDRNTYLNHADHKAFGGLVKPLLADVFVLDFTSTK